jgi:hypothetical protein
MKTVLLGVCLLAVPLGASAEDPVTSLGFRQDTEILQHPDTEAFCPATPLRRHDDGTFENGYAWRFAGVVPPDYGAWAECYEADFVCGVELILTQTGYYVGQTMDVYVWEWEAEGNPPPGPDPGNVICMIPDVSPGPMAFYPEFSMHNIEVCCETTGSLFAGYWPNWPGAGPGWYIASDEDGPGGGCPRTKLAPGIGYPTGWGGTDLVPTFYGCKALGIRVFAGPGDCQTSSVPDPGATGPEGPKTTTWGAVKALY